MKINVQQRNVWFCSDPHFCHKSLVKGVSNWKDKSPCRDFDTLEEHDNALVDNINSVVKEDDVLFCLGDWSFGNISNEREEKAREFRNRINCKEVYLCEGNHDQIIRDNENNIKDIFSGVFKYLEVLFIEPYVGKTQGVKSIKQRISMMHYSIRSWNGMRKGAIHLFGHSHGSMPDLVVKGNTQRTMDIGFDTHPEFRPYSYWEIKEIMNKREVFTEDHH